MGRRRIDNGKQPEIPDRRSTAYARHLQQLRDMGAVNPGPHTTGAAPPTLQEIDIDLIIEWQAREREAGVLIQGMLKELTVEGSTLNYNDWIEAAKHWLDKQTG